MCKADSFPVPHERMLRNDESTPKELVSSTWKVFFFLIILDLANLVHCDENTFTFFFTFSSES